MVFVSQLGKQSFEPVLHRWLAYRRTDIYPHWFFWTDYLDMMKTSHYNRATEIHRKARKTQIIVFGVRPS
jgi:hypothetical protein